MIEEVEFRSILSLARRILDVYGRRETPGSPLISHTHGDVMIGCEHGVIEIFFRGSLVFRHDPKGEITDFFETSGIWIDEMGRAAQSVPSSSSGIASQRQ
jgi:hypothetical protein